VASVVADPEAWLGGKNACSAEAVSWWGCDGGSRSRQVAVCRQLGRCAALLSMLGCFHWDSRSVGAVKQGSGLTQ
jgi:hypothetical protein